VRSSFTGKQKLTTTIDKAVPSCRASAIPHTKRRIDMISEDAPKNEAVIVPK
jgi:hypothetical protein